MNSEKCAMIMSFSNIDDQELTVVVEPYADERVMVSQSKLVLQIDVDRSTDCEIVYGDGILSIYIPDGSSYLFSRP